MALQDILERKEILLKSNDMNNEEKAKKIAMPCPACPCIWTKEKMYNQEYCKDCVPQDRFTGAMEMAQWKDEQAKQLHKIIIKLWDMLDWIDTYADLKINGSENDVYFSKIENKTKERFDFVKSDGYDLFINDEKITNNEHNTTKTD